MYIQGQSCNSVDIEDSPVLIILTGIHLTGIHLRKQIESRHIFSLLHNKFPPVYKFVCMCNPLKDVYIVGTSKDLS